jgi:hypothetical protein
MGEPQWMMPGIGFASAEIGSWPAAGNLIVIRRMLRATHYSVREPGCQGFCHAK